MAMPEKTTRTEPDGNIAPERPLLDERSAYEPRAHSEQFMVPLLSREIDAVLARWSSHAGPGARVLDVGCGNQPLRGRLEALGFLYTGLDVAPGSRRAPEVVAAIDERLPDHPELREGFPFVLCTEVLEHVADWDQAFRNLFALTRPGGECLVTCPFFYRLHEEPYDYWRPTLHALTVAGRRAGFDVAIARKAGDSRDVLGTVLGTFLESLRPAPAATSLARVANDVRCRALRNVLRVALYVVRRRSFGSYLDRDGALYLSNVVVFRRPG